MELEEREGREGLAAAMHMLLCRRVDAVALQTVKQIVNDKT